MRAVQHVTISGGGIAGPALAFWLDFHGISSTVVERASAPRTGGYAVDVRGVAIDVLDRMNLRADAEALITQIDTVSVVRSDGRRLAGFETSTFDTAMRSFEILRGDLMRVLQQPQTPLAEYRYGDRVRAVNDDGARVRVDLESGQTIETDLLVGADGMHSSVRGLVFGPELPYLRFLGAFISIFSMPNDFGIERETRMYSEPGRGYGIYSSPRADGIRAIMIVRAGADALGIDRADPERQQEYLRERFRTMHGPFPSILDAMAASDDFYFDSVSKIVMERWSSGRVTLLGDAGYCPSPMSGQGTSLALVGAYVLAAELARCESVTTALRTYEDRMRPFVERNQAIADAGIGLLVPSTRAAIALRNLALRAAPLLRRVGNGFDARLGKAAESIELPPVVA